MSDMIAWLQFWIMLAGAPIVFGMAEAYSFPKFRVFLLYFLIVVAGPWMWNLLFWNAQLAEAMR